MLSVLLTPSSIERLAPGFWFGRGHVLIMVGLRTVSEVPMVPMVPMVPLHLSTSQR